MQYTYQNQLPNLKNKNVKFNYGKVKIMYILFITIFLVSRKIKQEN